MEFLNNETFASNDNALENNLNNYQENWIFQDKEELFDGSDYIPNKEELTPTQKALHRIRAKKQEMLKDNIPFPCTINSGEYFQTSNGIDVIKLKCDVNDGSPTLKVIEDTFIFGEAYFDTTMERLETVLGRFHYSLTDDDSKDLPSIAEAINRLQGRNAKVKQYTHNDDKRYWFYSI